MNCSPCPSSARASAWTRSWNAPASPTFTTTDAPSPTVSKKPSDSPTTEETGTGGTVSRSTERSTPSRDATPQRPRRCRLVGEAAGENPHKGVAVVVDLATSLYDCDYNAYLKAVVNLKPVLDADRLLRPHAGYLLRELHVKGYGFGLDEPCWPPPAYWAGSGRVRTPLDDEASRRKALGLDDEDRLDPFNFLDERRAPLSSSSSEDKVSGADSSGSE